MKLTKGTDYGLRGILHLARQPQGKVVLVTEIARAEGVPESYLAKIFQDLSRSGILVSHRGAKGGFSLIRDLSDVSLLEVVEAIEGPIALQPCLDSRVSCDQKDECAVSDVIGRAQTQMLDVLRGTTLEQLVMHSSGRRAKVEV